MLEGWTTTGRKLLVDSGLRSRWSVLDNWWPHHCCCRQVVSLSTLFQFHWWEQTNNEKIFLMLQIFWSIASSVSTSFCPFLCYTSLNDASAWSYLLSQQRRWTTAREHSWYRVNTPVFPNLFWFAAPLRSIEDIWSAPLPGFIGIQIKE